MQITKICIFNKCGVLSFILFFYTYTLSFYSLYTKVSNPPTIPAPPIIRNLRVCSFLSFLSTLWFLGTNNV